MGRLYTNNNLTGSRIMLKLGYSHTEPLTRSQMLDGKNCSVVKLLFNRFYSALFSALEQAQCAHVACDSILSDCILLQSVIFCPPKWCTESAIWLLHGWYRVKLRPPRHRFCVHHSTTRLFTVSLRSKPHT